MLDIFKLNFGSKLVKGMVTKAIRKYVKKQFGIDIQLDLETLDFHQKVYDGYCKVAEHFKERIVSVDASQDIENVYKQVLQLVKEKL